MSSHKVINGSILPLMLGTLMMTALVASVINDQRYGESLQPGFDSLTAKVVHARYDSPATKNKAAGGGCDVHVLTQAIDERVLSLPSRVTTLLLGALAKKSPGSFSI